MSKSLIDALHKAGYKEQRLGRGDPDPSVGALVTGVFTEVDEGNRTYRALIGFGADSAKMNLYVTMSDLSSPQKPLYNVARENTGGKKPGAAITLNPYAAVVKFAMEKNATEKTVRKTAFQISDEVVKHLKQYEVQLLALKPELDWLFPMSDGKDPVEGQREHGPKCDTWDVHPRDRQTLRA